MEGTAIEGWRKSSFSGNGGGSCVEVGQSSHAVFVRDTKQEGQPGRTVLTFGADAWNGLLAAVRES